MFIFACPKTNQKVQPITWSAKGGLPCAARQELETSEDRFTPPSRLSDLCGVYAPF